jgi:parallel beta-helix repeat protein
MSLIETRSRNNSGGGVNTTTWYDAVVDGGLDPTGATDQSTQIASFYAAIPANAVAYFPAGTYQGLHSPNKAITILGDGKHRTTFIPPASVAASSKFVNFVANTKCEIRGVKLNAQGNVNIVRGVNNEGNGTDKHITVADNWFENFTSTTGAPSPHGSGACAVYLWTADACVVENNDFVDCVYGPLMDNPGPDCRVVNNRLWCTTSPGVCLSGILFRRGTTLYSGSLCEGNTIENVRVDPGGIGVNGHGIDMIRCQGMRINGNTVRDTAGASIHVGAGSYGSKIIGNDCSEAYIASMYVELGIGVTRVTLATPVTARTVASASVTIPANGTSFTLTLDAAPGFIDRGTVLADGKIVHYNAISGSQLTGCTSPSVGSVIALGGTVQGTPPYPDACTIIGNTIHDNYKNGVSLSYSAGTIIQGNEIHECGWEGIFSDSDRVAIEGNRIYNTCLVGKSNTSNPNVTAQIRVTTGSKCTIFGNHTWNNIPTPQAAYGIAVGNAGHTLTDNICTDNVTGPIFEQAGGATNLISENPGYSSTTTMGLATLVAGTATVTTAAVTANSRIFLTKNSGTSTGALRVSARTAGTSFVITSSDAADTSTVAWQIIEP